MPKNVRLQGKLIQYKMDNDEGEDGLFALTTRMRKILLQNTEYLDWVNRYIALPDDLNIVTLHDWVDDMRKRLMTPFEICAKMIECLSSDEDVRDAFRQFILNDDSIKQHINDLIGNATNGKGLPTNPTVIISSGVTNDELWAQCIQIWEYTNDAIVDILEVLEVQTNNIELMKNTLNSIPMFRYITNALPVDSWLEFSDYWVSVIQEQYNSGYTETIPDGTLYKLSCELFCLCKEDKTITVERIWNAVSNLLVPYTSISWNNASELIETTIGTNDNSEVVALVTHAIMWGFAKITSAFGLEFITTNVLKIILEIAKNDANDDWQVICEDCSGWTHVFPDENIWSFFDMLTFNGATSYVEDSKIVGANNSTNNAVFINFSQTVNANVDSISVTVEWSGPSSAEQAFIMYIDGNQVAYLSLNSNTSPATLVYNTPQTGSHEYKFLGGITGNTSEGKYLRVVSSSWNGNSMEPNWS